MPRASVIALICLLALSPCMVEAASEIILDNPSASLVGSWITGTSATAKYGSDYYYGGQDATGSKTATYTPTISVTASDWSVYVWYANGTNRPLQAQHIVHHAAGDDTLYINQQINGGFWYQLGTYTMNAGTGNYLRVTNYGTEAKVVIADGVRFYSPTATADTTPPVISSIVGTPRYTCAFITWTTDEPATSQVQYGLTSSYGSSTTEDTHLVTSHSVVVSNVLPATLYHYRVRSKDASGNLRNSSDYTFTTLSTPPPEFRAVWADAFHNGFLRATEVTTLVNTLKNSNYNALVPEVRKRGDAYYDSAYEPRATNISDPPPWDPLSDMIAKAHAQGLEVHPWIVTYAIWTTTSGEPPPYHMWYLHRPGGPEEDWALKMADGTYVEGTRYNLDPAIPEVQDYVCKVVLDIVSKYDIEGFNFDYIRYPGGEWGYNQITRQRFYDEFGYWPPTVSTDPNWFNWCEYRRRQVSDLVKKCYCEILNIKPEVKVSACLTGWGGLYPSYDFTQTDTYRDVFQNWHEWAEEHYVDVLMQMGYKDESNTTSARDFRDWVDHAVANKNGRHVYNGQGCYMNTIANSIIQMQQIRGRGAEGIVNYSYASTNSESRPNSDFYDAVKTNMYQTPVSTPDMPWKSNPTTGIIFGTVTNAAKPNNAIYVNWVYKATVTATGPATQTTQTDATGTYGFMDLPPGTYSVSVSKTGFSTRTYTNQVLAAGQVLREDFDLGTTTASSPSGTVAGGWSIISLPLEPVAPNPETVFNGISIDGSLYRWDNPTRSFIGYDMWTPGTFGNCTANDGYYLYSSGPATISYSALGGTAAQHDIPISTAGWAIVGCPYLSDRWWADTQVTKSGETVSMTTAARDRGWLNSVGWWWDNSSQSLRSLGLPDDFPASEYLQPWHGYWVETYYDNLTLNLR